MMLIFYIDILSLYIISSRKQFFCVKGRLSKIWISFQLNSQLTNVKMRRLIIQSASSFVALRYIVLHSRCTHYGSLHVASHGTRICMALASASRLRWGITLNSKNWNAPILPLHLARRRIRVALHYARFAFAPRFPLRRHYVGIPLRTELAPRVELRPRCITRRRSYSRYTDANSRCSYQSPI